MLRRLSLLLAVTAPAISGCIGTYYVVEYLPFAAANRTGITPAFVTTVPTRPFRELGVFEAFARADGVEDAMRRDIARRAGTVGCDAVVIVPVPAHAGAPRTTCENPSPMIRAICIEWLP